MANDGKIYITISDRRFGQNKAEADEQNKIDRQKQTDTEPEYSKYIKHRFRNLVEAQVKQAVNYAIGNIGNFTGDYIKQQQVTDAKEVISFFVNLGTAVAAGAQIAGGAGAAFAIATVLAGTAVSAAEKNYSAWDETSKQNRAIAQLRTRAGLNSTNNSSRGTDQ